MKKVLFFMSLFLLTAGVSWAQNVAKIGSTEFATLQDAVDDAYANMTGDVTIELINNTSEIVVVCQKPGLQLTIDGQNATLTGQIIINYGRNASDNTASTSITNLNFVYDNNYFNTSVGKYFIALPSNTITSSLRTCDPSYTGQYNSSHNISVSNCSFNGNGSSNGAAAFYVGSQSNGIQNITLNHLTVVNAHSLVQIQGGVNGLSITNCKAVDNVKNGINISGGTGTITITNDTITTLTGGDQYALRLRGGSTGTREAILSNNQFIAPRAFEMNNSSAGTKLSISSGTYKGVIYRTSSDASELSFTGGIFDEDSAIVASYCALGYMPFFYSPGHWIVTRAYKVAFEANGGSGVMDTMIVNADSVFKAPECTFNNAPQMFKCWNTKADGSNPDIMPNDVITLTSDTTLYAQWQSVNTITYDNNGGTGTIAPQTKPFDETVTLSDGTGFSYAGHNLYRWNTRADGMGGNFELGGTSYSENKDTTLYAVWFPILEITEASDTNVTCYHFNNGKIVVSINGGESPYQYVLLGGALTENDTAKNITETTYTFDNLKPGVDYYVIVSDGMFSDTSAKFTIMEPDTLTAALTVPVNPCPMQTNYEVSVLANGGNGGNHYVWADDADNVDDIQTVVTRDGDDYKKTYNVSVTVTDSKGCVATASEDFTVSAVVDPGDGRFKFTCPDDIEKKLYQYCEVKITEFGTPTYSVEEPGGYEGVVTITNDIATVAPDSMFTAGDTTIITWTATDTCGTSITCEQKVIVSFYDCPTATDRDGNLYTSVRLGSNCMCWLDSNLKTTKYSSNGNDVENVMSYYSESFPDVNDNVNKFGYLYDWYAAVDTATNPIATLESNYNNGIRTQGICPNGWFLPTDEDFAALEMHNTNDLRSTNYWIEGNGTNATGFNAVPSGFYNCSTGRFEDASGNAYYWSCHPVYDKATGAMIDYICEKIWNSKTFETCNGMSVRCVYYKDNE